LKRVDLDWIGEKMDICFICRIFDFETINRLDLILYSLCSQHVET
jgi:hypothetical protein